MQNKCDEFSKIDLTVEEDIIFRKLKDLLSQWNNLDLRPPQEERIKFWEKLGELSYELYTRFVSRGIEVKFNKDCFKNRYEDTGHGPESIIFHNDIDVPLGLIAFIEWPSTHDEPRDITQGIECEFNIFIKRRSEKKLPFRLPAFISRTSEGWHVLFEQHFDTDKQCSALLNKLLSLSVSFPQNLGVVFENLWRKAALGLGIGDLKIEISKLAQWVEATENGRPRWC